MEFHIEAPLDAFIVLNWKRDHKNPVRFAEVDLAERRDLLAAIMKSPGPFYEPPDGSWPRGRIDVDAEQYLHVLAGVRVYEVSGGVDFAAATQHCLELVRG